MHIKLRPLVTINWTGSWGRGYIRTMIRLSRFVLKDRGRLHRTTAVTIQYRLTSIVGKTEAAPAV